MPEGAIAERPAAISTREDDRQVSDPNVRGRRHD